LEHNFQFFGIWNSRSDEQPVLSIASALVRRRQITGNPGDQNACRPVSLHSVSGQSDPDFRFPLEKPAILFSTNAPENAALSAILPLNGPPCFGLQLVFLDSDGRLDLLLSNLTSIASWNSSHGNLEHVDRSVSQAGRDGFHLTRVPFRDELGWVRSILAAYADPVLDRLDQANIKWDADEEAQGQTDSKK